MARCYPACIALALITFTANAQITVTNSVFPAIGDTLHYAYGNQPGAIDLVMTAPGGPQTWDLSGLQEDSTADVIYRDPATGAGAADFPGAELLVVHASGQEDYLNVTATEVGTLGYRGVDPLHLGSSWTVHQNPPVIQNWAPVNFFDIRQANSNGVTTFPATEMPPGTVDQLGVDSMRFHTSDLLLSVVDAWGTLTIPGGSFAVLRDKRTHYTEARLDAKLGQFGWVDVTDQAQTAWGMDPALFGADTISYFHFINDQTKETIAVCSFDAALNVVTNVRYKVVPDISTAVAGATSTTSLRVFPNPAADRIQVQAPSLPEGTFDLLVRDATGRQVMRRRTTTGGHGVGVELDISGLEAGMYQGSIVSPTGDATAFRFVKR